MTAKSWQFFISFAKIHFLCRNAIIESPITYICFVLLFFLFQFVQMDVQSLNSWRIKSPQPFYPIGIRCIGNDDKDRAVIIYAAHTVNTFIFRNFGEDIKNDKAAHKSYLHKSFFPDRIKNIVVGTNESAILLENGRIMCFTSAKKLMTLEYLSGVKSLCSTRNGFVIIKTSSDGMEFSVEFHPDAFQDNVADMQRRQINISFDKIPELQNTWHHSCFKIKELPFKPIENPFLKAIFPEDIEPTSGTDNLFYFLSIDNSFCSIHLVDETHIVNPILMCTTKIVDFWAASSGDHILLLLENGTLDILYLKCDEFIISKKSLYFGNKIQAYEFFEGVIILSDGLNVEYGMIEFEKDTEEFRFNKKTISLPGIVALTYLPKFALILLVSENCRFYSISMQDKKKNMETGWFEIDENVQNQLSNVKYELIELIDTHDNLLDQQNQQKHIFNVIKLKHNDINAIQNDNDEIKNRFIAACAVTQSSPIQQRPHDTRINTINISNSLAYDRKTSFFVTITICHTVRYANEFGTNLWSLCCRWLNDKHENVYANIKLDESQLSSTQPMMLIIHLQQKHLPCFHMDISTIVRGGNQNQSSVYINFPVQIEQPDYCELMTVSIAQSEQYLTEIGDKNLICTIPSPIPLHEIFGDKLDLEERAEVASRLKSTGSKAYTIYLLGKLLTAIHNTDTKTLRLVTRDATLMNLFKKHVHRKVEMILIGQNRMQHVTVAPDTLKEYYVSK